MKFFESNLNTSENIYQVAPTGFLDGCLKTGIEKPWRKHKLQSLSVANSMKLYEGLRELGTCIENCGTFLVFKECPNGHGKKLCSANFCGKRSCVLCAWRRSMVTFHQVLALLHKHKEKYSSDIPLFLTLTIPNCRGFELRETIKKMSHAFKKLFERRMVRNAVRGWFRSLEVTYNEKRDTFHPHYHVILIVPKNYFDSKRGLYISQDQWLEMWRESMQDFAITQVDIRKIKKRKKGKDQAGLVAEAAKYATKPSNYIKKISSDEYYANPKVVKQFYESLRNVRLLGFGGVLKDLRKALKQVDVEKADLIHISGEEKECACSICESVFMEVLYSWRPGLKNYFGLKTFTEEALEYRKRKFEENARILEGEAEIVC